MKFRFYILLFILSLCTELYSQKILIKGFVKDQDSRRPIPFANVWIKGTIKGVHTDSSAYFSIDANPGDIISASSVGYSVNEIVVKKAVSGVTEIFLKESVHGLQEVIVKPEIDFAKELFMKIVRNKEKNSAAIKSIQDYSNVTNTTIYLAIDTTSQVKKYIKNIDKLATVSDDQKFMFTPIFLSEVSNRVNARENEIITSKKEGIFPRLNQAIESNILQYLVVDLDFYENQLYIFDKGFISPISDNAMLFYNIYFNDSTDIGDRKIYSFSFSPKNKFARLFTGRFSVSTPNYSLRNIEVYFQEDANINFVNGFRGKISYDLQSDGSIFFNRQEIDINLSLIPDKDTTKIYGSQRLDKISNGNWLLKKNTSYSTFKETEKKSNADLKQGTGDQSDEIESADYLRVDELKKEPAVRTIDAIGGVALTGYVNIGKFDLGPVFDIYSTNSIEGNRFSIPLRTSEKMFEHYTFGGYVGYGTASRELKYGANIGWQPFNTDKLIVRFNYSDDYSLLSQDKFLRFVKKNPNTRGNGNFIAALTSRERNPYLKGEEKFEVRLQLNTEKSIELEIAPYLIQNTSTPEVNFIKDDVTYINYKNYGTLINMRYAFNQHFDTYYFDRIYYITQKPVLNLSFDFGRVKLPDINSYSLDLYCQLNGSVVGFYYLGPISMRYMINGGYLFGSAPYDMLDMPAGTLSLGYSKYGYNLLHFATFAHSLYVNTHLEFSGGGILLNNIPGVRNLKLREMASIKCHYGTVNNSYNGVFDLPEYYFTEMSYPYLEVGLGLSNIFKVLRVEYVFQVGNYHNTDGLADKYGLFFRTEMSF